MHKTTYALLITIFELVHIGIGSAFMYNSHFNRTAVMKAQVAQSVEHHAIDIKVVGSSPTVSKHFFIL